MTVAFETVDAKPEARIKRDQYGRYVIPHPITGKDVSWTRATTLASTLADRYGLEQWSKRNVVLGIGVRADLYAQAAAALPEDRDTLNQIVAQAEEASKAKAGANTGSALHRFTERADAGEDVAAPAPWDADLAAYRSTMSDHGISVVGGWLERVLLVPEVDVAGTCDRLLNAMDWQLPRIGDLKTAKDVVRYGMTEIALQLSLYAHATHWFDPDAGELHEIDVRIDQERAVVMHLPVGRGECTLYEVDIAAGWDAVQLAVDVRNWRKRKDLCAALSSSPVATDGPGAPIGSGAAIGDEGTATAGSNGDGLATDSPPAVATPAPETQDDPALLPDRIAWLQGRVDAIKAADGGRAVLARCWSEHPEVPTFPKGGPTTPAEVDVVSRICWDAERELSLPFPPADDPAVEAFEAEAKAKGLV